MCILGFWLFLLWHHQNDEYYFHIFSDPRPPRSLVVVCQNLCKSYGVKYSHYLLLYYTFLDVYLLLLTLFTVLTFHFLSVNQCLIWRRKHQIASRHHIGEKKKRFANCNTKKSLNVSFSLYKKNLHSDLFCSETWFLFLNSPTSSYDGSWSRTLLKRCF